MLTRSWMLTTAQLALSLNEEGELPGFVLPDTYRPFLATAESDIICWIKLRAGALPVRLEEMTYVFASKEAWATFTWGRGWGFVNPHSSDRPWRRCIFWDPATKQADVWFPANECTGNVFGDLRFPFLAALFAQHGVALAHAAAVKVDGEAWLFIGPSGHGKSTWSRLCQQGGYEVLDEDRVALRVIDGQTRAFGTPWHPELRLCSPKGAPVRRIFFLQQTAPNTVEVIPQAQAATLLLKSLLMPIYDAQAMQTLLTLAAQTAEQTENYRLGYAGDAQFPARVLAM
jgi:hypothetical protein